MKRIAVMPGRFATIGRHALLFLSLLATSHAALAQVPVPAAPLDPGTITVWTGGTIHTVSGDVIENGTVIARDGVIEAVGQGLTIPSTANVIDFSGKELYPGLFSAHTALGLVEIGSVRQSTDHTEVGTYNPNVRAEVALNPDSEMLPVTRANGILTALTVPRGGRISGTSAVIQLDGWTWESLTVKAPVGFHVNWPGVRITKAPGGAPNVKSIDEQAQARRDALAELNIQFDEARAYVRARGSAGLAGVPKPDPDPRLEAYVPVLRGDLPVIIRADDAAQIVSALDWARDQGLRMILLGGRDAPLVADRLVEQEVPVIVTSTLAIPARDYEPYDYRYTLPERLRAAGVEFCIASEGGAAHERRLPYHAAMAWSYGLPHDEAVRAITLYPAQILGMGDRLGSIEVGKDATLIVTDGDPLEIRTHVERAFIAGREISLESRHTRLYEKYRQRVGQN
ncbi:MAG: amidohydrolase family protein [Candidatus Eisenbacteria bacterium]